MTSRTIYTILGGTLAERPTQAEEGRIYLDFESRLFYRYSGGAWIAQPSPVDTLPHYTPAEIITYIDGITNLAQARVFLKLLVKHLVIKNDTR